MRSADRPMPICHEREMRVNGELLFFWCLACRRRMSFERVSATRIVRP